MKNTASLYWLYLFLPLRLGKLAKYLNFSEAGMGTSNSVTLTCHECGHQVALPPLIHGQRARCPRCHHTLSVFHQREADNSLALALSAIVFGLLSLPFNFLSFKASGQEHTINLPSGLNELLQLDYISLAVVTGLATLLLPILVLLGIATLSFQRKWGKPAPWLEHVYIWVNRLAPWSMAEIFLVGTLVSLVKITELADVSLGLSFYAFIGFSVATTATLHYYDKTQTALWLYEGNVPGIAPLTNESAATSIQHTWALLITAMFFYIPANALPIMHTELLGDKEPSTIIGGVFALWEVGSYPVAIVIFVASVFVPVAKLVILIWLTLVVQLGEQGNPNKRIKYYRFTEWIGRWSMVDVFVVAILVALIQLGKTISIYPGPAALAFCAVVFVTMTAAMSFDSRLLWHSRKKNNE